MRTPRRSSLPLTVAVATLTLLITACDNYGSVVIAPIPAPPPVIAPVVTVAASSIAPNYQFFDKNSGKIVDSRTCDPTWMAQGFCSGVASPAAATTTTTAAPKATTTTTVPRSRRPVRPS